MLFTEFRFIVFFIGLLVLYWLVRSRVMRIALLVIASFIFYGAWDYRFLALLGGTILIAYTAQNCLFRWEDPKRRSWVVRIAVIGLLGILGFFKYFNFFVDSFVALAQTAGLNLNPSTLSIILPVGISFFIFQSIGFIVDVKRGDIKERHNLLEVAFFVSFFPQLKLQQRFRDLPFKGIIILFMIGFFKKAVLADSFGMYLVDPVFAEPGAYNQVAIIVGVFAYALQIYCDFSGYSDMAIATSRCFGYRLPINFNAPYLSLSITEFWRRWHISLSNWLRDYLYISLGGNRGGTNATYRNLMLTMILGGLWHGASWNFLFWGYLHGAMLAVERVFGWGKLTAKNLPMMLIGWGVTFYFTCICWVFFRSSNFEVSLYIVSVMLGGKAGGLAGASMGAITLLGVLFAVHLIVYRYKLNQRLARLPLPIVCAIAGLFLAAIFPFIPRESQPFIYFQF